MFGVKGIENRMINILPEWEHIDAARLKGMLLIIGAPDVGKSTFARYLFGKLQTLSRRVAYLDGDPGQSTIGPPTTMTLAFELDDNVGFPPQDLVWRSFVGALSPAGHMLQILIGAAKLVGASWKAGAQAIIYDTTGLIGQNQGGAYLKLAKIDLLRPTVVFAIEREKELDHLLKPLRRSRRVYVEEMAAFSDACRRDLTMRQAHRAEQFARYFMKARLLKVTWSRLAVFPAPHFTIDRLVALEDANGFTLGLGIVQHINRDSKEVVLLTPLVSLDMVDAIRLGDVAVDVHTFVHRHLSRGE
jgi:polynucleotide 5'-hydroxyl-kinase GRC3/NOL9